MRSLSAPPYALLASAIVFGMVLGFGAALTQELRSPRIADAREAERVAGARVISVIRPRPPSPERGRRMADRVAPPYIDPGNDAHQLVWLFVGPPASSLLMLTVSGESSLIAAIVAANLGAVAAEEARNVIVIDTDSQLSPVSSALRIAAQPGLQDIIDGRVSWPEATQHATIGRDRVIDVIPSGVGLAPADVFEPVDILAAARVAVPGHNYYLQFRRVPALIYNLQRPIIAYGTLRDCYRSARPDGSHAELVALPESLLPA